MSVAADSVAPDARARPRLERRSLRRLRLQSSVPRYALYGVAAVAIAHTLVTPLSQHRASSPPRRASGFDLGAAGYATSFTRAYLSYSAADPAAREAALASFVGSGGALDQDAGVQLPDSGSDAVGFAQPVAEQAAGGDARVVTVEAATTQLGTVYLAVTVARSSNGALQLVGAPAVVGPPASAPAAQDTSANGQPVSDAGVSEVVDRALSNYLRGDASDLQSDLAPGAGVSLPGVALRDVQVGQLSWQTPGRIVGADVQATAPGGATLSLHYAVSVTRQSPSGDRWFVTGIETNPASGGP